jgi:hypothetical protein
VTIDEDSLMASSARTVVVRFEYYSCLHKGWQFPRFFRSIRKLLDLVKFRRQTLYSTYLPYITMPQITAHINETHRSLLDHDSDLDTSAEDDIQMEEDGQDHEEDDNHETVEFHNNNELREPMKIPTPPPTVLKKRKRGRKRG